MLLLLVLLLLVLLLKAEAEAEDEEALELALAPALELELELLLPLLLADADAEAVALEVEPSLLPGVELVMSMGSPLPGPSKAWTCRGGGRQGGAGGRGGRQPGRQVVSGLSTADGCRPHQPDSNYQCSCPARAGLFKCPKHAATHRVVCWVADGELHAGGKGCAV